MTFGISTDLLLQLHVVLSLIGLASGLVVLYGWLTGGHSSGWVGLFLLTTILTSLTGFPLPPLGFDPARAIGILSLALLTLACAGLYVFGLAGAWRRVYVGCALAALYLNAFVAVVQSFQKISFLQSLAPTQSEPPFVIAQVVLLVAAIAAGFFAMTRSGAAASTG